MGIGSVCGTDPVCESYIYMCIEILISFDNQNAIYIQNFALSDMTPETNFQVGRMILIVL